MILEGLVIAVERLKENGTMVIERRIICLI